MISLKLFAGTNIGLRDNNEDNFIVCPDLNTDEWIVPADHNQIIRLGSRGCLMLVADGMGGQNAGEVASAIAVDTVREMFLPDSLPVDILNSPDRVKSFLRKVILECDTRIKKRQDQDPSTYGMGSTIVIAWLIGRKLYIAWLGDSRAYSYIPGKGIARLSKDHSYVQQLVDEGTITEDEAMDHPNSNVITRSLGDPSKKAKADVVEYDITDDEIIMLCSDGLCGVLRDEEICALIEDEKDNLQKCKEKLSTAALAAGGSDNITISLMQIQANSTDSDPVEEGKRIFSKKTIVVLLSLLCLCLLSAMAFFALNRDSDDPVGSVKIWLDKSSLSTGDKTAFHIAIIGDSVAGLEYDNKLVGINFRDSTLTVKNMLLLEDTTIYIRVVCKSSKNLSDSVALSICKSNIDIPKVVEPNVTAISGPVGTAVGDVQSEKDADRTAANVDSEDKEDKGGITVSDTKMDKTTPSVK